MTDLVKAYTGADPEETAKLAVAELAKGVGELNEDLVALRRRIEDLRAMASPDFIEPVWLPVAVLTGPAGVGLN